MKVLLVDDHPLVLSALQTLIPSIGNDIAVVGVETAPAARAALRDDPDFELVLLDLALGDSDGFELLAEFRTSYPAIPVVVVSASDRTGDVIRAVDGGAMGYLPKKSSCAELKHALRLVMTGSMYVPTHLLGLPFGRNLSLPAADAEPAGVQAGAVDGAVPMSGSVARGELHKFTSMKDIALTPRQAEVLSLLLQGLPNKLIARQLNLSVETVKDHVAAVLRALGASTRTQAVLAVSQMTQGQGMGVGWRPPGVGGAR
jgi:DNA-binding NarL/FixJ family response regulator